VNGKGIALGGGEDAYYYDHYDGRGRHERILYRYRIYITRSIPLITSKKLSHEGLTIFVVIVTSTHAVKNE